MRSWCESSRQTLFVFPEQNVNGLLKILFLFCSTFGQFFAGMVDGVFVEIMPEAGWRMMLGLAAVPGIAMFYGFLTLPESPRWLAQNGRVAEAEKVLQALRESDQEATDELTEIMLSVAVHRDEGESDNGADEEEDDESGLDYGTSPGITSAQPSQRHHHHHSALYRFVQMISDKPTRRALFLGCGLMVVQQCSGINTYVHFILSFRSLFSHVRSQD